MSDKIIVPVNDSFCSEEIMDENRVYVKKESDAPVWAIYNPDGECMAQTFSREMALAIIRQNDLNASQVH